MVSRSGREPGFDTALTPQLHWERYGFDGSFGSPSFNYVPGGDFELLRGGRRGVEAKPPDRMNMVCDNT
jgi:hypothetical protein